MLEKFRVGGIVKENVQSLNEDGSVNSTRTVYSIYSCCGGFYASFAYEEDAKKVALMVAENAD